MPKLYEYCGITVLFYSNDHQPIHVHGKHCGRECRAEIFIANGHVIRIQFGSVNGKRPLKRQQLKDFRDIVEFKKEEIIQRWMDFFVRNIPAKPEVIRRRVK